MFPCLVRSMSNDGRPKRWVVIRPPGAQTGLLLAKADGERQADSIGEQYAGRVGLFLRVDDFEAARRRMLDHGVQFLGEPRDEPYGRVVVFLDLSGNKWDLLGPSRSSMGDRSQPRPEHIIRLCRRAGLHDLKGAADGRSVLAVRSARLARIAVLNGARDRPYFGGVGASTHPCSRDCSSAEQGKVPSDVAKVRPLLFQDHSYAVTDGGMPVVPTPGVVALLGEQLRSDS